MKEKWEELIAVLNRLLSIYKEILALSQQKKQILVAAKSQDLARVVKEEERLILQLAKVEGRRRSLVRELMATQSKIHGEETLEQLQKIATPDVVMELEAFASKMNAIMAEIVPLNKVNTALVRQALIFINYNINVISQTVVGPTYAPKGHANEQTMRKIFDMKV